MKNKIVNLFTTYSLLGSGIHLVAEFSDGTKKVVRLLIDPSGGDNDRFEVGADLRQYGHVDDLEEITGEPGVSLYARALDNYNKGADPLTIREILTTAGISQAALAARFQIPLRTIENWATERRECPVYIRLMMMEILDLPLTE